MQPQADAGRICLDFGTAFSKASVSISGKARPLRIGAEAGADHRWLSPSVMFVDKGRVMFGPAALESAAAAGDERDALLSFKTILAAQDLERALDLKMKPSIDPTRSLKQRDALILYLAYLDQLIRRALSHEKHLPPELADAPRRYTTPIWRTAREGDRIMARLFDEAAVVAADLGEMLLAPDGASLAQAGAALARGRATLGLGQLEAGVFEAHAAAAAYAAFAADPKRFFMVIDMGAGTTDLAGFERIGGADQLLSEIPEARQSCGLAGDEIDDIIASMLLQKLGRKPAHIQARVWRALKLNARTLKRDLFTSGRCVHQDGGARLSLKRSELDNAPRFKRYQQALVEIFSHSAAAMHSYARASGAGEIGVLLAGGGANLGFLEPLAAEAFAHADIKRLAAIERLGDGWGLSFDHADSDLYAMPQVAISLGGALAALEMRETAPLAQEPGL